MIIWITARLTDKTRKELHKTFEQFGLKITEEANLYVVNFLDVIFVLIKCGKHTLYRKPNNVRYTYASTSATHPVFQGNYLYLYIDKRISTLPSDMQTSQDEAPIYQTALEHSNFTQKVEYIPHATQQSRRIRQRNIIRSNPPFSKNIKTNIAPNFLNLEDTHFPAGHKLHKIFNQNTCS